LVSLFWTVISLLLAKIASPPENSRLYEAVVVISKGPSTTGLDFSSGFAALGCLSGESTHYEPLSTVYIDPVSPVYNDPSSPCVNAPLKVFNFK